MALEKRLFLLDAYALIFRGYYAFIKNPRINSKGLNTSAIMGFMNSLLDVINREKPEYLAVAFDKEGSKFRNELFPEYKANRDETPEAIKIAVPYIHSLLEAMHIPIIEIPGIEADDLIGTLSKQAERQGFTVYMVTPDKDYAQLVSENVFMYRPARMGNDIEIWGIEQVKEKFGVDHPLQVIDFLGMMGDAVDNIPGLPGVGEKTAQKLLSEFGSMENLLENTHQLKGALKTKIEAHKEQGLLSKKLATILLDCPVSFDQYNFKLDIPDFNKTNALFEELEFRRMAEQFQKVFSKVEKQIVIEGASQTQTSVKTKDQNQVSLFDEPAIDLFSQDFKQEYATLEHTPHFYQMVEGELGVKLLVDILLKQKVVCFDTETTKLNVLHSELVGIAFAYEKGKGYYVPFPEDQNKAQELIEKLRPFFENEFVEKVGQNLKYDLKILKKYNIEVRGPLFDTMIAHYLINPDMRHNMDILAETYLKYSPKPIEALIGKKGRGQKSMREIAPEDVKEYAVEDADITLQLKEIFELELTRTQTRKLFDEIEIPLISVLADMEMEGVRLDVDFLQSLSDDLKVDARNLETTIYQTAGQSFNLASPKQLGEVLFDKLKIGGAKQKKTKTGQYATGEEVLSFFAKDYQIVRDILEWRQLVKLQNTYVEALPQEVDSQTGRVHTEYMQAVATTGRLSSNNPNLQNIPIRTLRGRQIRKAFIARDEDYVLLSADYSQIELRIIAALSGEINMISSFAKGEDIHKSTASKVFNVPLEEVTQEQRSQAKTVNFGIIYGVSAFGLSNQTELSRSESAALIEAYYKTYPRLKEYVAEQIDFAREHGYVQTVSGRRRYLKDISSGNAVVRGAAERNAVNAPIQGSAADIIKIAMIRIQEKLKSGNYKSKMLLQVHDELIFDVYKPEIELIKILVKTEMEQAIKLSVPLVVDIGLGRNWLEAH